MPPPGQSVRATSAQEQRFRIDRPNSRARTAVLVGLDPDARALARALAEERPVVRSVLDLGEAEPDVPAAAAPSAVTARTAKVTDALRDASLVVAIASVGSDARLADTVGALCRDRGLGLTAVLVDAEGRSEEELAASLGRLRPLAAMVVVTDGPYVAEMLRALRV